MIEPRGSVERVRAALILLEMACQERYGVRFARFIQPQIGPMLDAWEDGDQPDRLICPACGRLFATSQGRGGHLEHTRDAAHRRAYNRWRQP